MARLKNRSWSTFQFSRAGRLAYEAMKRSLKNGWWQPPLGFLYELDDANLKISANCTITEFNAWSAQAGAGKNLIGKSVERAECGSTVQANAAPKAEQANLF